MVKKYKSFYWLNNKSRSFLEKGYLQDGISPEDRIKQIGDNAERILNKKGFSEKFQDYMARGWFSLASPIWSSYGNKAGYDISCFGSFFSDNMNSILNKTAEVGMMSKGGGGTSGYFGEVRGRGATISDGSTSNGVCHFLRLLETTTDVVSQGSVRRGSFAAYLPIEHPDFEEFLKIRDAGNELQNISYGACISDDFMERMLSGGQKERDLWSKMVKSRCEKGYPYIFYTGNTNRNKPKIYKDKNLEITHSNLCTEIALVNSPDESFVCCLSSINLLHYDEWKDTDAIEVLTYFLDSVITEFIEKTEGQELMTAPRNFAIRQRALGLGVLGWHSYLQSKMIPFASLQANMLTNEIFRLIDQKSLKASQEMAIEYGEPELLKGYGERNVTRLALAPTTSSSFILGQVSPSIEPLNSNYFVKKLAKGDFTYKNPYLKTTLHDHNKDDAETWKSVLRHGGSVQHLDFLSDNEKDVFKTFGEISQKDIVIQAGIRQKYLDQTQSLNLMVPPSVDETEISDLLIYGWGIGLPTFYYQRSANPSQELKREIMNCSSCEG